MHAKQELDAVELHLHSFMTLLFNGSDQLYVLTALLHRKAHELSTE